MKKNDYQAPTMIIVTLQSPMHILTGSPDLDDVGVESYNQQPGLTW